jgi:hypothetical protein
VRDIDRSCKNLHGNEKKTWEKNQYIYKMYYFADKQNIQTSDLFIIVFVYKFEKCHLAIDWCLL